MESAMKTWWQSRTIWAQLVALAFMVGQGMGWWPQSLTEEGVVTGVMSVIALLTIVLRLNTSKAIGSSS